ncbi:ATP-binding cassette domain-containing protein [Rhizobium lusitanum]|uniref:ATP-binding cassette domain-containing protein n=1 Tax=Rhizobium lusitanum TaxID=293958 RepID=A0A6L9UE04_9HYPH|nr:ABC transporter ATP-binding protein [Rhizobium lusitanum]NEI72417.1 ATP-binding cassette domain-containing protein [Rhizobium lusitanum]
MNNAAPIQLTVDKVDYSYRSKKRATLTIFRQLSLTVGEGEFVSLIGPSGCGKSTMLRLIMGLQLPVSGTIRVAGTVVNGPSTKIGMVFQQDALLPWRTALKNVCLGLERDLPRDEAVRRAHAALEQVGLAKFADAYPHQLSGGMRQRVNLARALALSPEVVLMDEPFAALDMLTRERMQEHLINVWERDRKTVVFVTHQLEEAVFLSDRVILLGPAPAGVLADVTVNLPRPRTAETKKSVHYHRQVDELAGLLAKAEARGPLNA